MSTQDPAHVAAQPYQKDFAERVELQLGYIYPCVEKVAGIQMQTDAYVLGYNDGYAAGLAAQTQG